MSTPPKFLPLTIFCGKGGVGKTSMALAFALQHAERGRPTLVVTSHPLQELAVSVSLAGLKENHPRAAAHLFIIHLEPRELLARRIRQAVPSEMLVTKILESPIYQSLIEIAPGLKEIMFLGRLHQLAEARSQEGKSGKFDLVVWDAPATGHFLQTLKVSQSFETHLSGAFALLGKEVAEYFSDSSNFFLVPVTTLEEMAVEETIELCGKLREELKMKPSGLICNMASPLLGRPDFDVEQVRRQVAGNDGGELKFVLDRHLIERKLYQKLKASIHTDFQIVKRKPFWNSDMELLMDLSRQLKTF